MDLALFDFDGTITTRDTFTPFVVHAANRWRLAVTSPVLVAMFTAYKLGGLPATLVRAVGVRACLGGQSERSVAALGKQYATTLSSVVRHEARERLRWHEARGDRIVIVSASLGVYLRPWCAESGFDVLCSELASRNGVLTGQYLDGDCSGNAKARRVRERYRLEEYTRVYAYGDTDEDRSLLELAHEAYFRWRPVAARPPA
jgi:phosphatidylglycerophosphatase C